MLVLEHCWSRIGRAAAQDGNFAPAVPLGVGAGPAYAIAADVNGDGRVEMICANTGDDTLTVLTNNGSGVYRSNATLVVDAFPIFVAAVSIKGGSKLDLISVNFGLGSGNTLTVLTNNGDGVFGSNAALVVDAGPVFVAAADVNGDGKPDLISANAFAGTLTVLTNNGSGQFGFNATLAVSTSGNPYPDSIAVADVNGEGKADLISANFNDGTLTVLTNNGSGGFGFNATLPVGSGSGSGPTSVVAADVNGDGKPDLISANANDGTLTVLTNNGSGAFGYSATFGVGLSSGSSPVRRGGGHKRRRSA